MQHTKSVSTNIKSVTNDIDKLWYLKHIIIIWSHYITVDRNAYAQSSILSPMYINVMAINNIEHNIIIINGHNEAY